MWLKRPTVRIVAALPVSGTLDRRRVVIEVDGKQHYSTDDGRASTSKYAEMLAEDRRLHLAGYEVYRFGRLELSGSGTTEKLRALFDKLSPPT